MAKPLVAFKVGDLLVFAPSGSVAKVLAAPTIKPDEAWCQDVTGWVALRADRSPEHDALLDSHQNEAYIHGKV